MAEENFDAPKANWGGEPSKGMSIFDKIKNVLIHPGDFFDSVRGESGVGGAFKYLAILSIISLVASIALFSFNVSLFSQLADILPAIGGVPIATIGMILGAVVCVVMYFASLIGSFIGAGFIHLFSRLLGGKGDYASSYKAFVYGSTPALLFGWVPVIGVLASIYNIVLQVIGISKLHGISAGRAVVAILVIPVVIGIIILVAVTGVAFFFIMNMAGPMSRFPVACSPCFSYFAFVDYSDGSLMLRTGPTEMTDLTLTSIPQASLQTNWDPTGTVAPGSTLSIGGLQEGETYQLRLEYTDAVTGLTRTDSATLRA